MTHLSSTTWLVRTTKNPLLLSQHSEKVCEEGLGMYYCDFHFRCRFSSNQGVWLCLAIACPPCSISCSDHVKCPCNEENWKFFFHTAWFLCLVMAFPQTAQAIENLNMTMWLLDAIWEKCSRTRKNKETQSIVQHLLIEADMNRIHLNIVSQ